MRTARRPTALLDLLRGRFGLEFPEHRWDRVEEAAALVTGAATADEAATAAAKDPALLDALLDRLTVGETYFFREPEQFRVLADEVLPDLRRRRGEGEVRAWSAGCASGEEAYSLAMALLAARVERARVLATDVSPAALRLARAATYGPWSLRGLGARRALPFLEAQGRTWAVAPRARDLVTVERLNLAADPYPQGLDLIFCRNVLIYLDAHAVARVARGLHAALAPGGWLFVAATDPPLRALAPFEEVATTAGRVYRRPLETARRVAAPDDEATPPRRRHRRSRRTPARPPARRPAVEAPLRPPTTPPAPTTPAAGPPADDLARRIAGRAGLGEPRARRPPAAPRAARCGRAPPAGKSFALKASAAQSTQPRRCAGPSTSLPT
ncbi:MAG: hypothetical protein KF878_05880 [Planctomycetes bacterium]|nr:hypothetical protein [Planctomycetota bacterium]